MENTYVFWDNSNVFISAQGVASRRDGVMQSSAMRIHFPNLMNLARAGRNVKKAFAVGSVPPGQKELWNRMQRDTGINIELYERGAESGQEQGVDQCLQTHMLRALADANEPQICVLLTGDGSGANEGIGFLADLKRMHEKGWGIEVLSWEHSCNRELRAWAEANGVFVCLDNYYPSITFIEGGRSAQALSLLSRKKSSTRKSDDNAEVNALREKLQKFEEKDANKKKYGKKFGKKKKN